VRHRVVTHRVIKNTKISKVKIIGETAVNIRKIKVNDNEIAIVSSDEVCISDVQSALDLIMSVNYETKSRSIVINKDAVTPDFFVLSTRIAGEILQKFINYRFKLAIVGDFSGYTSKPLKDFIYESNNGRDIFFVSTEIDAIEKLSRA
jgi:hypothetical protein